MSNSKCDHYFLVRRGGKCPHCGDDFPGQCKPSRRQLESHRTIENNAMTNNPLPTKYEEPIQLGTLGLKLAQVGDVAVCLGEPPKGNPYLDESIYRNGIDRLRLLRRFRLGLSTEGFTLWYAPSGGGAKRITAADVDWERSGIDRYGSVSTDLKPGEPGHG